MDFTTAQKVTKHLGYFCNKICGQEIPKITQSGHTNYNSLEKRRYVRSQKKNMLMGEGY